MNSGVFVNPRSSSLYSTVVGCLEEEEEDISMKTVKFESIRPEVSSLKWIPHGILFVGPVLLRAAKIATNIKRGMMKGRS